MVTIELFELSFPEATPVTTKTLSASSLSATPSWTSPELVPPADTVDPTVVSVTSGAALTDMVIVYADELYSVPSWTLKPNVGLLSEFAAGVNLRRLFPISDAVISWFNVTSTHDEPL